MKITTWARHRVVVGDGDWYNDENHDDDNGNCYEEKDHDDDRRKGGGGGGVKNRASICGGHGKGKGRQQSTKNRENGGGGDSGKRRQARGEKLRQHADKKIIRRLSLVFLRVRRKRIAVLCASAYLCIF